MGFNIFVNFITANLIFLVIILFFIEINKIAQRLAKLLDVSKYGENHNNLEL